jgi:hypothetical protein
MSARNWIMLCVLVHGASGCLGESSDAAPVAPAATAPDAAAEAAAPQAMSFDCGTFAPHAAVACFDFSPPMPVEMHQDEEQDLVEGAQGLEGELFDKCMLFVEGDSGFRLEADYQARCERGEAGPDRLRYAATFGASTARVCGNGEHGSLARVAPEWKATLSLPEEGSSYKISIKATSADGYAPACSLTVGGRHADAITTGTATVFSAVVKGGEVQAILLDCDSDRGLLQTGCYGFTKGQTASPPEETTTLALQVSVDRCPTGCSLSP